MSTNATETLAPEGNPLARWMTRFRVTNREFSRRAEIAENYLGQIRSGARRPGDHLKAVILTTARAMERDLGVADPVGVPIAEWFTEADIEQLVSRNGTR